MRKKCPPNTFCLDEDNIFKLFIIIVFVSMVVYFLYNNYIKIVKDIKDIKDIREIKDIRKEEQIIIKHIDEDERLLKPPGRSYFGTGPGIPINTRTRGQPNNYQQIGILKSQNNNTDIKPLFGRQTYRGSSLWNYYTALDSNLATRIPIQNNRNCIDTQGCTEISNGGSVKVLDTNYDVELYPYNDLQYIPYV